MRKTFCIFMLLSGALHAQTPKPDRYTVYVNYPAYSVRAEVSALPLKFNAIQELEYYWYYSNKIIHTQGGCDGKLLNGQFTSFYLSNNLKEKGVFKNGLRNGEWISWFENGTISETSCWKKGVKQGTFTSYSEKGERMSEANYRNGKLHGLQISYEEGKVKTKQQFKKGKEIVKAPKKEKQEKEKKDELKTGTAPENTGSKAIEKTEKSSLKTRIKMVFHKKEKKKAPAEKVKEKKDQATQNVTKEKKEATATKSKKEKKDNQKKTAEK